MDFSVRKATGEDAWGLAKVHVKTWQSTYAGLIHESFLKNIKLEEWQKGAEKRIANEKLYTAVLLRESNQEILGFVSVGPNREKNLPHIEGEMYALYLLPSEQRKGLGRRLFDDGVLALKNRKFKNYFVSVVEGNKTADFYAHMGGQLIGKDKFVLEGHTYPTLSYFWPEL